MGVEGGEWRGLEPERGLELFSGLGGRGLRRKTGLFRALNLSDAAFVDDDLNGAEPQRGDLLSDDADPGPDLGFGFCFDFLGLLRHGVGEGRRGDDCVWSQMVESDGECMKY